MKSLDLQGQRFGKLTVLSRDFTRTGGNSYWLCQCSCGKIKSIKGSSLKNGHTQSCGCLKKENIQKLSLTNVKNITNQRFGKLIAIQPLERIHGDSYWLCQCDCGNYTKVRIDALTSGNTKSCGCIKSLGEEKIFIALKNNNISFQQEYSFPDLKGENEKLLRFDFAIFNEETLKCLIEFQGIQHYAPQDFFGGTERFLIQQKNDNKKVEYCKKNNIPLIFLSYKEKERINIEYILKKIKEKGVSL